MARRPNRIRPYFVKVISKHFSKKLLIPRKYVSLHRETLGKECVLWPTHTRDSFRVRTKHIDNELYFKRGWKVFATTHALKFGDFLIFRHVRDSEFDVDVLHINRTPREPGSDHILRKVARAPPSSIGREKNHTETAALTEAEAFISSSDVPFFKKIMKAAELKPGGYLYVPAHYAKQHIKNSTENVKIVCLDKVWIAKVVRPRGGDRRTFLNSNWSHLAREGNIGEGDVCVFQLISTEENTLKLTIFRNNNAEQPKMSPLQTGTPKKTILQAGRPKKTVLQTAALSEAEAFVASSQYPFFKKIMRPAYVKPNGCLHVPEHFAKEHLRNGRRIVKIECLDKVWTLRRQPSEKRTFLGGWSDLAKENSLRVNDVCVFQLINTEDCTLKLKIFKQTSGENQKQCGAKLKSRSSYSELTQKSKKYSKRAFEEAKESEALANKAFKCGEDQKHHRQLAEVKLESSDSDIEVTPESKRPSPSDRALEEAEKFHLKLQNPSFVSVMRPSYINHHFLHMPKPFVEKMGQKESGSKVKLQSSNNEINAKMCIIGKQYRMNAGWRIMVKKECIKVNDVCVLELINEDENVIKVSIFKCNS